MTTRVFIPDGYTEDVYIAGIDGLHPPVRIKVRTMLAAERAVLLEELGKLDEKTAHVKLAKAMVARVLSWDLKDDDTGAAAPITVENVLRLRPALFLSIASVVRGFRGSDPDPEAEANPAELAKITDAAIDAAIAGIPMKDLLEAEDEKN